MKITVSPVPDLQDQVARCAATLFVCVDVYFVVVFSDGSGFQVHSGMSHKGLTGCVQDLTIDGKSAGIIRNTLLHNVQQGCNAPRAA